MFLKLWQKGRFFSFFSLFWVTNKTCMLLSAGCWLDAETWAWHSQLEAWLNAVKGRSLNQKKWLENHWKIQDWLLIINYKGQNDETDFENYTDIMLKCSSVALVDDQVSWTQTSLIIHRFLKLISHSFRQPSNRPVKYADEVLSDWIFLSDVQ